ncbi:MAG: catechol 1,2-dioxygenase [Streptosporangiales bacterium]|nr:catechol 1,2-dioxygenase [Streptosporangiales bacterium]
MTTEMHAPTAAGSGTAATEAFRASVDRTVASDRQRIDAFARDILHRIHDAIREHGMTYPEFQAAKQWLVDVGEAGEWPLFLDVFVEHVVEEVATEVRHGSKGTIQGPYYLPSQTSIVGPGALPMREDEKGDPLVFTGTVRDTNGIPLPAATLDIWHADADGYYSGFAPGIPDGNLRAVVTADAEGRFEIHTVRPAPYEIPKDGPTGALIAAAGWHAWRPAHLHLLVTVPGHQRLTTQLYFSGGEWLDSDVAEAVKPELVLDPHTDADGTLHASYDFVLDPVR